MAVKAEGMVIPGKNTGTWGNRRLRGTPVSQQEVFL